MHKGQQQVVYTQFKWLESLSQCPVLRWRAVQWRSQARPAWHGADLHDDLLGGGLGALAILLDVPGDDLSGRGLVDSLVLRDRSQQREELEVHVMVGEEAGAREELLNVAPRAGCAPRTA